MSTAPAPDRPRDGELRLPDGRRLSWREGGDPAGRPLLALHGTPGSRLKFDVTDAPARTVGLRVISPDRWGYGGTDPHPAPTLAAFADDMRVFADRLGIDRLAVLGVSGGGPYAAAVASALGHRVGALALVAPVGPIAGERVAMSRFHAFCFRRLARAPWATRRIFASFRMLLGASPRLGMQIAMSRAGPTDRRVLATGGVAERLGRTFAEGMRSGTVGPVTDMALFAAPWSLALGEATAPARLWLGAHDRHVPLAAARLLAERLPRCEVVEMADAGHLWVSLEYPTVLGWVAETIAAGLEATRPRHSV